MLFKTNIDATFTTNPYERKQMKKPLIAVIGSALLVLSLTACGGGSTSATDTTDTTDTTVVETPIDTPVDSGYTNAEEEFLFDVHNVNNSVIESNPDEQIVSVGHIVCDTLDEGNTVSDVSDYLISTGDYTTDNDIEFVASMIAGAVINLCPEYKYQLP